MIRKSVAEILGTFALVFCGTGAIIINNASGGAVSHVGIAITFGLIVMTMTILSRQLPVPLPPYRSGNI